MSRSPLRHGIHTASKLPPNLTRDVERYDEGVCNLILKHGGQCIVEFEGRQVAVDERKAVC